MSNLSEDDDIKDEATKIEQDNVSKDFEGLDYDFDESYNMPLISLTNNKAVDKMNIDLNNSISYWRKLDASKNY